MQVERVPVARIAEYNPCLGNRCHLLLQAGLQPYTDTEEEITDYLEKSAEDPAALAICMESSRCTAFYEIFKKGETPFAERDPIILLEHNGTYWVDEGKHRVCMAKRAGVAYIDAKVTHLEDDLETLLEPAGRTGTYTFTVRHGITGSTGTLAVLWIKPPYGTTYSVFSSSPVILNRWDAVSVPRTELIPGVFYEVERTDIPHLFRGSFQIRVTVTIEKEHCNTKIWLYTIPVAAKGNETEANTVFRRGRWRKHHLNQMFQSSLPWMNVNSRTAVDQFDFLTSWGIGLVLPLIGLALSFILGDLATTELFRLLRHSSVWSGMAHWQIFVALLLPLSVVVGSGRTRRIAILLLLLVTALGTFAAIVGKGWMLLALSSWALITSLSYLLLRFVRVQAGRIIQAIKMIIEDDDEFEM